MLPLTRSFARLSDVAVGTTSDSSTPIHNGSYGWGSVEIPTGSSLTQLTWYAASSERGPFLPASDRDGAPIVQTVSAGTIVPLPTDLGPFAMLKAVGDAAGVVTVGLKG